MLKPKLGHIWRIPHFFVFSIFKEIHKYTSGRKILKIDPELGARNHGAHVLLAPRLK
jgi:hypothetical protein